MIRILIGTIAEITARMAGAPSTTSTTITGVVSVSVFSVASISGFSLGDSISVGKEKSIIAAIAGSQISLDQPRSSVPNIGATVRFYDADYTRYRDTTQPFTFIADQTTGGSTGDNNGGQNLVIMDADGLMTSIVMQNRITIYDDANPDLCLFGGLIVASTQIMTAFKDNVPIYQWMLECQGYQWEADQVGIEESPFVNVNAGKFLTYLLNKWTNLSVGEIDTENSPRVDYIRLASFRLFSDIGNDLAALWPGCEFFIQNNHTGGAVYFRQVVTSDAPITLNQAYLNRIGKGSNQYVSIRDDDNKVANIVAYPYYREQSREPDFQVQATVTDPAFLKTSVVLAGQPSSLEEALLFYDDFSDGGVSDNFIEYDIDNPNPPDGYNPSDGFLIEGPVNSVAGFHLLSGTGSSGVNPQPVGRLTDPGSLQPFTGEEGQLIYAKEVVVDQVGYGLIMGIIDQTTLETVTISGSTATVINVADSSIFQAKDIVAINGEYRNIQSISTGVLTLVTALSGAPASAVTVENHRLSRSRVQFGLYFRTGGQLTYFRNGVEKSTAPWTYVVATTYSFRLYMQAFESTVASGTSTTGCTLADATSFTVGDVIQLYIFGSRVLPINRVILTKTGSAITYAATSIAPKVGYRVRTLPKIVLQAKGGTYGDIIGRDWTTLYTDVNTWQTSATVDRPDQGIAMAIHQLSWVNATSFVGTITEFQAKNPIPISADIGTRHLQIGTQDTDSADPDIDCLVRKVGSHYQLDFFPDTKALWASGTTLELRYKERYEAILESKDTDSIRAIAISRGYVIPDNASEQQLIKLGGVALTNIQLLPTPITDIDAINQSEAILNEASKPAFTAEIATNNYLDSLCQPGQVLRSDLPNVPDMVIQQVQIKEIPGPQQSDGSGLYYQTIRAGTVDRLSEILKKRTFVRGARLVLDDGKQDDSFTKIERVGFSESVTTTELWQFYTTPFYIIDENGGRILTEAGDFIISG